MNCTVDFRSESKTCEGRCIKEMQKILEPSVVMEFLEVIRDFHNDDRTATKLKNMILSETSEAVKLLNERASEMILMVDEIFLNRRQRQSSFYRLCHKLVRKGLPEGSHLPDESKCVCFSEENLRRFSVDPGTCTSLEFSSNLASVKEALKQYFGELRCTDCGRCLQLCQSGNMLSCVSDCICSSPTISSQHKVHEAILELCKAKDNSLMSQDSWYLTQLKRDADYYKNRSRNSSMSPSDESVISFEVISPPNSEKNDVMDNESLCSDFSAQENMLISTNKILDSLLTKYDSNDNVCQTASDIQHLSKNLNDKLMKCFSTKSCTRYLTDASKSSCSYSQLHTASGELCPALVLKQSFSPYFNKCNKTLYYSTPSKVPTVEHVKRSLQKLKVDCKLLGAENKVPVGKQDESNPSDFLKIALNSFFKDEMSQNWLHT